MTLEHTKIKFGTDGWRALLKETYNKNNIYRIVQAFCDLYRESENKKIYVGFDRREMSREMALFVSQILADQNYEVILFDNYSPTPSVSWCVKNYKALAGIVITASHNPAGWNGIKFKDSNGCAASTEFTQVIENKIQENDVLGRIHFDEDKLTRASHNIKLISAYDNYVPHLKKFFDIDLIKSQNLKVVYNAMHGAGAGFLGHLLGECVTELNGEEAFDFKGVNPEPIDANLKVLKEKMLSGSFDIGVATDGDADRIAAYDEKGQYISSHQIFALMLLHNVLYRKLGGDIVKSYTTTSLINKIADKHNLNVIETPVGFKNMARHLVQRNALMGGEESGGISLREHVHERDGIFNCLTLLEILAVHKKPLSSIINEMEKTYGSFIFRRRDFHLSADKMNDVKQRLPDFVKLTLPQYKVVDIKTDDGIKLCYENGAWLMARSSGTEPLVRLYAESSTLQETELLLDEAVKFLGINK